MVDRMVSSRIHCVSARYKESEVGYLRAPRVILSCRNLRFMFGALNVDQTLVVFTGRTEAGDNDATLFNRY